MGIVDGSFVSDISFRAAVVEACREATDLPFEAHLTVTDPERQVPSMVESGCQMVIVHAASHDVFSDVATSRGTGG